MKKKIKRVYAQMMSFLYGILLIELIAIVFFPLLFKDTQAKIFFGVFVAAVGPLLVLMLLIYLRYLEKLYLKEFICSTEFSEINSRFKSKLDLEYATDFKYTPGYLIKKNTNLNLVNLEKGIVLTEFRESVLFSRHLVRIEFTNFPSNLPDFVIFNHFGLNKPKVNRNFLVKETQSQFKNKFKLYTKQPNLFTEQVYLQIYNTFARYNSVLLIKNFNTFSIVISDKTLRLTPNVLEKENEYLDKLIPSLDAFKKIINEIEKIKQT